MPKARLKPVFKTYDQHQSLLLPPSLEELIPANHPVRIVSQVIDSIDTDPLLAAYPGGGSSAHHPVMLLKILVYCYISNIYSSRKIEEACRYHVHAMWLCAMRPADHNTINRFRGKRLQEVLRNIFTQVVKLLAQEGLLSLKEIYTDGTKIEANANRYTFVWGASIKTNKEKIASQITEMWDYAQSVAAEELDTPEPPDFTHIDAQKVTETIEKINTALKGKPDVDQKIKAKLNRVKKDWPVALERYALQEKILDGRGSYSKTDPDATFMRMKEDHLGNSQLKPAYNIQVSSSNQYAVDYTVHNTPGDPTTLIPHLEQVKADYGAMPEEVCADAAYGSEENYAYLEKEGTEAFVKYTHFDGELSGEAQKKHPYSAAMLEYREEQDCFICPSGQVMENMGTAVRTTSNGYKRTVTKYGLKSCAGCPLREACYKGKEEGRVIEVSHKFREYKRQAKERLTTERGIYHRKKRGVDTEPLFGNIKSNHGFRRFMLRGTKKVETETGLLCLAQNLRKKSAEMMRKAA